MISYRFKRRAFLGALSGGVGLEIMLRNLELAAQTSQSPPRFLGTYWPLAIIPGASGALWTPTDGPAGGFALQPFLDIVLAGDMITLRGLTTQGLNLNGGGGREGGMVVLVTGANCGGTRANRGEGDDGFASGPSIDQLLLKNVPALTAPAGGAGFANSICDLRTDLGEVSAKCMSYSRDQQPVTLYSGGTGVENIPLMGTLSPLAQYTNLFSGFMPSASPGDGGARPAAPRADAMLKQLVGKRSVLDFGSEEIVRLKALAPSEARQKLQIHFDAIQTMESALRSEIDTRYPTVTGTGGSGGGAGGAGGGGLACAMTPAVPADVQGTPDWTSGYHGNYGTPKNEATDDMATHEAVGRLHMDVLRAAFQCDVIRCATFQWAPSTSHVGFKGLYPGDEAGVYLHHAVTGAVGNGTPNEGTSPDTIKTPQIRFLFNVESWYFARHAQNLKRWKDALDGLGNPLLDTTIIPFVTETADYNDGRANMPGMIFGGSKLGMQVHQYKTGNFRINALWGTIAHALGYASTDAPLAEPIPGLWAKP